MGPSGIVFMNKMKALPEPEASAVAANLVSPTELSAHCTPKDGWVAFNGRVYDVTAYCADHPGGPACMHQFLGKDITQISRTVHSWVDVHMAIRKLQIGVLTAPSAPPARNPFAQ